MTRTGVNMAKEEIMTCLRSLLPVRTAIADQLDEEMEACPDTSMTRPETVTDLRQSLLWLWKEIEQLPDDQAAAVLLRMESAGMEALAMEAGFEAIARKLAISAESLVEIVNDLPLEFERIAGMPGDVGTPGQRPARAGLGAHRAPL